MLHSRDIAEAIERIAPASLAEDWDNCGLQAGSLEAPVRRVLVALTPLPDVFEEAEELGADFLLLHHPLIFGSLNSLNLDAYPGDLLGRAIKSGITVYASHTSYDAAPEGVSAALANTLELQDAYEVLSPRARMCKLVVFIPQEAVEAVAEALSGAGAGVIGEYTHCTFRGSGTGTFLGNPSSQPYIGEAGRLEQVEEIRLETVVPAYAATRAVAAVKEVHPYEEPALDIYPLDGHPQGCGYGRVGRLPEPMDTDKLCQYVAGRLQTEPRVVASPNPNKQLERIAVMGGSGGSFIKEAAASGAAAYITGDLDYHDALLAESLGLTAIDAGHAATELPSLEPLAQRLGAMVEVPVSVSEVKR